MDEVLEVVPGLRAVATRNVPGTLALFATHFPRFPVLPGVLILDDIAETARLAAGAGAWTLAEVSRIRYRRYVEPGDRMVVDVRITEASADTIRGSATVTVDGRTVTTVRELRLARVTGRVPVLSSLSGVRA
ncbi:hydroxymyristoyl-ACP dehydratase [Streptomyces kaniharaensis]|uniref:Hydroxymyristoyl-ACP dehydratase n=2 Tax=Streptomyces kaniharaensis TaxID=212423 RepID=A0A6N7KXN8_9ACTN|nr:hydroxymyristoyl-ACP dehydratase [Streptomyces kaniharaensis]